MRRRFAQDFGLVTLALLVLWTGMVSATPGTITVGPSGCDYTSIQAAIDNAIPGSVITITSGTYQENLVIDRPLILRGEAQDQVIIGGGEGCREGKPTIYVASEGVRIEDLTITKCCIGIAIRGTAEMRRLILTGNAIGLEVWDFAQAALEDSLITDNTVGIEIWAMASASITNSSLEDNGIGVKVLRDSSVTIIGARIFNNGLGVEIWDSDEVLIEGSTISENKGDGLWIWGPACTRVTVQGNSVLQNGGNGIRLGIAHYRPDSIRAEIKGNTIQQNAGCGVWVDVGEDIEVTGQENVISGNLAGGLCPPAPAYFWPSEFVKEENP
jgi:parallel beta-helix repeat protein